MQDGPNVISIVGSGGQPILASNPCGTLPGCYDAMRMA